MRRASIAAFAANSILGYNAFLCTLCGITEEPPLPFLEKELMLTSKAPDRQVRGRLAGNTSPVAEPATTTPAPAGSGLFPRTAWRWLPLALLALAALTMAADCAIAQWFAARPYPRLLAELIEVCESFGNGLGVFVLALVIYQLDAERRWVLPRVLTASLGAGMAANGLKMLLARTRPRAFDFEGGVLATFGEWLPLGRGGAAVQSFPSAHTATAVGLAVALAWLYPRGRWTFGALAVLVACQRMQSTSHYLSDVLVGAAVGLIVARGCVESGRLATRFDRLEARLRGYPKTPLSRWKRGRGRGLSEIE